MLTPRLKPLLLLGLFVCTLAVGSLQAFPAQALHEKVNFSELPAPERLELKAEELRQRGCYDLNIPVGGDQWTDSQPPHPPVEGPFLSIAAPNQPRFYMYCTPGTIKTLLELGLIKPPEPTLEWYEKTAIWVVINLLFVYAWVGSWLVYIGALVVSPLLSLSSFITHPMVRTGWPFILGFANLGFIIALLFIAFATMLQSESMGARRMLPRLLLAAILINFSLVIAGVIIDFSRLMMAIMVTSIGGDVNNLASLGAGLLKSSDLLNSTFKLGTLENIGLNVEASSGWGAVFQVFRATILIWFLAAGFVILIGGLLVRYIILILLLIVSPLAYLALAFPNMGDYAKTWWRLFLKYVFYGPIALFILIMVSRLNATEGREPLLDIFSKSGGDAVLQNTLSVIITGVMFVAAAMAGSKFGIMGANATMSFANKRGRQLAGGMTKGLTFLPRYAGKRMVAQPVKDAARTMKENYASRFRKYKTAGGTPVGKWIMGAKRDKDGKPLPGEDTTIGQAIGRRMSPFKSKDAKAAADAPSAKPTDFLHPSYNPDKLIIPDVRAVLSPDQLRMFADIDTTMLKPAQKDRYDQQVKLLLNDTTVVRTMDAGSKASFMKNPDYQDQILRTLRAIAQQDSAK